MPAAFHRTFASLRDHRERSPIIALVVAIAMLGGWLAWGFAAEVSVFRSSRRARVEVTPAPTQLAAATTGRVTVSHLQVGARVARGDVLVALEATPERIAADRARARSATLEPEVASIDRELAVEEEAGLQASVAEEQAERQLVARMRSTDAELAFAEQEFTRERQLAGTGATPKEALDRVSSQVRKQREDLQSVRHESESLVATNREHAERRRARKEQLERQRAELASELAAARAEADRLAFELERRTIRAPVAGILGEVGTLRPGEVVREGDVIATIVPEGSLHVVAEYDAAAYGRLSAGQHARLRVAGFPSTRYGVVHARVERVASEVRDGTIRVELALATDSPQIPIRHGMTGTVDIEVDRASPITLLLRAIGDGVE